MANLRASISLALFRNVNIYLIVFVAFHNYQILTLLFTENNEIRYFGSNWENFVQNILTVVYNTETMCQKTSDN